VKALVLTAASKFEYKDVPEPEIGPRDVMIRVRACGICGSDVHGMDGSSGRRQPPIIMGHEASGEIAAIGSEVTRVQVGDRVTFDSTIYCGECDFCRSGAKNLCDNRRVIGVSCDEYRQDGAMAEYIAVPERILYMLPDQLSFEHAAMIEPLSVAFHAVNVTPIRINDSVAVIGSGLIGLLVIQTLRTAGCGRILAIDLDEKKLALAKQLGADRVYTPGDATVREVRRITGGKGVNLVYDAVGINASLRQAFDLIRKGGNVVLVGNLSKTVDFPMQYAVTREINTLTSCASNGEYEACLGMLDGKRIDLKPLLSGVQDLSEGAVWFEKLHRGADSLIKVVLKP